MKEINKITFKFNHFDLITLTSMHNLTRHQQVFPATWFSLTHSQNLAHAAILDFQTPYKHHLTNNREWCIPT